VLLIGWNFLLTSQKHYLDLGSARHQYGIPALVTQTSVFEGSSGNLTKRQLFSQATIKDKAFCHFNRRFMLCRTEDNTFYVCNDGSKDNFPENVIIQTRQHVL